MLKMLIDNVHDRAMVSATSEALPASNTQLSGRSKVWRSSGTAKQTITATLTSGTYLDSLILYRHNLSSAAIVTVRLYANNQLQAEQVVSAFEFVPLQLMQWGITPWGASYNERMPVQAKSIYFDSVAADRYEIEIDDALNPDGYIQISRIMTGLTFEPTYNPAYGLTLDWIEDTEHVRTESGSLKSIGSNSLYRKLSFDLERLTSSDRARLTTEMVKAGKAADVFVSVYPGKTGPQELEYQFLCRRDSAYSPSHIHNQFWSTGLTFIEI